MRVRTCKARKISCAERNGNDNISIVTPSWQNSGIFWNSPCLASFRGDRPKPKQIKLRFSRKIPSNLLTQQMKYCGNSSKFSNRSSAPVTCLRSLEHLLSLSALLVIASSEWKLPGEEDCCLSGRTRINFVWRGRAVTLNAQMARVTEHAHSFCRCPHSVVVVDQELKIKWIESHVS